MHIEHQLVCSRLSTSEHFAPDLVMMHNGLFPPAIRDGIERVVSGIGV